MIKSLVKVLVVASMLLTVVNADVKEDLIKGLENKESEIRIEFNGNTYKATEYLNSLYEDMRVNDPYIFWSAKKLNCSYENVSSRKTTLVFRPTYYCTKDEEKMTTEHLKYLMAEKLIKPGMTDKEKVTAINNHILEVVDYDTELKKFSVYEALRYGKATCLGYTLFMKRCLDELGIENKFILGESAWYGGSHCWNLVKIGDEWLHVDVTMNDSMFRNMWLLVNDEGMKELHEW